MLMSGTGALPTWVAPYRRTCQRSTSRKMHVAREERGPRTITQIIKPTYLSSHRSLKTNLNKPFRLAMHLAVIKKKKNAWCKCKAVAKPFFIFLRLNAYCSLAKQV